MHTVDESLISVARSIGPLIHEEAAAGERARRLSRRVLDALAQAGLQRMLTPKSLGGLEVHPVTCARVVEEVAGFDSAAGWALQPGNVGGWWGSRLTDAGVEEIYGRDPSALMAAAFHPPQQAREVEDGFRVTGRAPLASNIHDAEWVLLTALVMDGGQPRMTAAGPDIVAVVLRTAEARIVDTWDTLGMRATDSNDVAVEDVFVPASRTFRLVPDFEPGSHYRGPLYRLPASGQVAIIGAPVMLAIARGAIDEIRALAQKTPFGAARPLRERSGAQATVAKAEAMWRAARLLFYDTLTRAWERAVEGRASTLDEKADLLLAGAHAAGTAATITEMMHTLAGTTGIYTRCALERHFRDAHTLRHHGFMSEGRFETAGQVYLGVPPEFALVTF